MSRAAKLTLGFLSATLLVGAGATAFIFLRSGSISHAPHPLALAAGLSVVGATAVNLLLRFARWHYLLRRLDVRLPTVASLGSFVGSFAFLPVPLYLGQILARGRLLRHLAAPRHSLLVFAFIWERVLDVLALTLLAAPAVLGRLWATLAVAAVVAFGLLLRRALVRACLGASERAARIVFGWPLALREEEAMPAARPGIFAVCSLLSVGAWALTALSVVPVAQATGISAGPLSSASAAAFSILVGALSLSPLGVGVSGMLLIGRLQGLGATAAASAETAFVFRAATAWLSVALGGCALVALRGVSGKREAAEHFDAIDECYDAWLPEHYREHLVARKLAPVAERLATLGTAPRGLDVGCGRGWYARELLQAGARIVGVDPSAQQLAAAAQCLGPSAPLVRGSLPALPFRRSSFDFAYVINVLHHMPTPTQQELALQEIAAAVRPGGLVFVHEMNVINPLFRFYLGYVFPVLKGIEEGTEYYLDPRRLGCAPGLRLCEVRFFTFVPDFVPRALLPAMAVAERWLERSPLSRYAAHFVAVFERTDAPVPC